MSNLPLKKLDYLKGFLKYVWDPNGLEATIDNTSMQDHCCLPHLKPDLQLNLNLRKATAWQCMTYQYFLALVLGSGILCGKRQGHGKGDLNAQKPLEE